MVAASAETGRKGQGMSQCHSFKGALWREVGAAGPLQGVPGKGSFPSLPLSYKTCFSILRIISTKGP